MKAPARRTDRTAMDDLDATALSCRGQERVNALNRTWRKRKTEVARLVVPPL